VSGVTPMTAASDRAAVEAAGSLWWVPLFTGTLWLVFSLIVFQFDATSMHAISIIVGIVCIAGAVGEILVVPAVHGGWRIAHLLLAAAFTVIGIVAFVHPQNTFSALATVFAFYLLLRGTFDIVVALFARGTGLWWTGLVAGIVQVLLAFWAAGDFGHKTTLLIVWVGATALAHGILQIILAFELKRIGSEATS
jgi:uncharacterized membrane protein HdeD (DUF308 family)